MPRDAAAAPTEASVEIPKPVVEAGVVDAGTVVDAARLDATADASVTAEARDAGASTCRIAFGPAELPFVGPASLVAAGGEVRVVANDAGKPRIVAFAAPPPPGPSAPLPAPPPPGPRFEVTRAQPCEIAGKWAYCQGPGGLVQRTTLGQNDTKPVAKGRAGTRFGAATLGEGHAVLATLDVRRTTEGETMQAFVTLDDHEPVRLSEDGAGATSVHLLPRHGGVVAVYIDARSAMLPVHARSIALKGEDVALGNDAVVFIGGPPERGIDFTLAATGKSLFALVPMPKETATFGVAAIPIEDPPKDDVQAVWSSYPNGLDPAPIAATTRLGESAPAWVARVRPKEAPVGSPRVLELGRLDAAGRFTSVGTVAEGRSVAHVTLTTDPHGAIWLVYGDRSGSWLERLVCT